MLLRYKFALLILALFAITPAGCTQTWDDGCSVYIPPASEIDQSINGNTVFMDMCASEGARCRRTFGLNKQCMKYDCILWFCSDNQNPDDKAVMWFEDWLSEKPGRTLVFVGRSFESDELYWTRMMEIAPKIEKREIQKKLSEAKSRSSLGFGPNLRRAFEDKPNEKWFRTKKESERKSFKITELSGNPTFVDGLDPTKTELQLYGEIEPIGNDIQIILSGKPQDDTSPKVLIAEQKVGQSRILIVPSGTFLLNYPLVNRENRKLAGRFIELLAPRNQKFLFLRMGSNLVERVDMSGPKNPGFILLQFWPICLFFWHLIALGIVVCFWRWPVFGHSRELPPAISADFRQHIEAYAELLKKTADVGFAKEQIDKFLRD